MGSWHVLTSWLMSSSTSSHPKDWMNHSKTFDLCHSQCSRSGSIKRSEPCFCQAWLVKDWVACMCQQRTGIDSMDWFTMNANNSTQAIIIILYNIASSWGIDTTNHRHAHSSAKEWLQNRNHRSFLTLTCSRAWTHWAASFGGISRAAPPLKTPLQHGCFDHFLLYNQSGLPWNKRDPPTN